MHSPAHDLQEHDEQRIRRLLNRRELAVSRHRTAISRQLGLSDTEMLAVAHLAQRGQLSPSVLGDLLELSSGGVSTLIGRLEQAGHLVRTPHPTDGRSSLVGLSSTLVERAGRAFEPLVAEIDALTAELDDTERAVVGAFLERLADISEREAEAARSSAHQSKQKELAVPSPGLWG